MVSSDDGKKEDLSAYSREDLVYKAKLAEQAERCVNWTRLGLDAGTTTGRVARRRRASPIARDSTTKATGGAHPDRAIDRSIKRAIGDATTRGATDR